MQDKNVSQHKFFKLQHEDFIMLHSKLKPSELAVYLYLASKHPFTDRSVEINTALISEHLGYHRRTVQSAIAKLSQLKLLKVDITSFKYRLLDSTNLHESTGSPESVVRLRDVSLETHSCDLQTHSCDLQTHSYDLQTHYLLAKSVERNDSRTPQTIKDYIDLPDLELQKSENEVVDREIMGEEAGKKSNSISKSQSEVVLNKSVKAVSRDKSIEAVVAPKSVEAVSHDESVKAVVQSKSDPFNGLSSLKDSLSKVKVKVNSSESVVPMNKFKLPDDLRNRLEMVNIEVSDRVIDEISKHHISKAYGAITHVEKTIDSIDSPKAVFLWQLPRQKTERMGSRYSPEILENMKKQNAEIEAMRATPEYAVASERMFKAIRAKLGR